VAESASTALGHRAARVLLDGRIGSDGWLHERRTSTYWTRCLDPATNSAKDTYTSTATKACTTAGATISIIDRTTTKSTVATFTVHTGPTCSHPALLALLALLAPLGLLAATALLQSIINSASGTSDHSISGATARASTTAAAATGCTYTVGMVFLCLVGRHVDGIDTDRVGH